MMVSTLSEEKTTKVKDGTPLFLGGIFILVGLAMVFFGVGDLLDAKASESWPGVTGKVVTSEVERHDGGEGSDTYHAKVVYEYAVEGIGYVGERVAIGGYGSSDDSHAEGIVKRYPEGEEVTVYYSPEEPVECLLEPGMQGQAWVVPGMGVVFLAAGVVLIVFKSKSKSGRLR